MDTGHSDRIILIHEVKTVFFAIKSVNKLLHFCLKIGFLVPVSSDSPRRLHIQKNDASVYV